MYLFLMEHFVLNYMKYLHLLNKMFVAVVVVVVEYFVNHRMHVVVVVLYVRFMHFEYNLFDIVYLFELVVELLFVVMVEYVMIVQ